MENKIIIKQISNPGLSFTENINEKILLMSDIIFENVNLKLNYSEFQQLLISNNIFTGSYIRSFIPFLYNVGMINDYNNEIDFNNFFTSLGKSYIEIIKTINFAQKNNDNNPNIKELFRIKSDIIALFLSYMCQSSYKFFSKYCDILCFVKEFKTINREEFYIMEYCIENNLEKQTYISNYRNKKLNYEIFILDNSGNLVDYHSNNAYNYFVALLADEQCNFINKIDNSNYRINANRIDIIDSIINDYEKNNQGGKNE